MLIPTAKPSSFIQLFKLVSCLFILSMNNTAYADSWLSGLHLSIYNFPTSTPGKQELIPNVSLQQEDSNVLIANGAKGFNADPDPDITYIDYYQNIYLVINNKKWLFGVVTDNGDYSAPWLFSIMFHPLNYRPDGTLDTNNPLLGKKWAGKCIETAHAWNVGVHVSLTGAGTVQLSDETPSHTIELGVDKCPAIWAKLPINVHALDANVNFSYSTNAPAALTFDERCSQKSTIHLKELGSADSYTGITFESFNQGGSPIPGLSITPSCPVGQPINKPVDCNITVEYTSPIDDKSQCNSQTSNGSKVSIPLVYHFKEQHDPTTYTNSIPMYFVQ